MGILPCLLSARAMSFHVGRSARFGGARSVVASICKFEVSLGTMKVLDVELEGSSLAH